MSLDYSKAKNRGYAQESSKKLRKELHEQTHRISLLKHNKNASPNANKYNAPIYLNQPLPNQSQHNPDELGVLYADWPGLYSQGPSLNNISYNNGVGVLGNNLMALGALGGEVLSQFRYETSMNQSKILLSGSISQLSSQISSIKSFLSTQKGTSFKDKGKTNNKLLYFNRN